MYGSGIGDAISSILWLAVAIIAISIGSCSYSVYSQIGESDIVPAIGNSIENIKQMKADCEKQLPRNKECVMVYDFVPVKKER